MPRPDAPTSPAGTRVTRGPDAYVCGAEAWHHALPDGRPGWPVSPLVWCWLDALAAEKARARRVVSAFDAWEHAENHAGDQATVDAARIALTTALNAVDAADSAPAAESAAPRVDATTIRTPADARAYYARMWTALNGAAPDADTLDALVDRLAAVRAREGQPLSPDSPSPSALEALALADVQRRAEEARR